MIQEQEKPRALLPKPDNIPLELRNRRQWIVWRYEPPDKPGEKWKKIPYIAYGSRKASTTDPTTWRDFGPCLVYAEHHNYDGIGYVFSADDPYVAIDLDHCRDPKTGAIAEWAREILNEFPTYAELSVSGEGVHIIAKGLLPEDGKRKEPIEVYKARRYFTFTGHVISNDNEIRETQIPIERIWARIVGEKKADPPRAVAVSLTLEDEEILEALSRADNYDKFAALYYDGAWQSLGYDSQSQADYALAGILKFYTQDAGQLERIMGQSALYRPKWDSKRGATTYGGFTVDNALKSVGEVYAGPTKNTPRLRFGGSGERNLVPLIVSTDVPALPEWASLEYYEDEGASKWLDLYVDYASCISPMTPARFHETAGLWLASTAIARRLVLQMPFGLIYPNIWALWLAPTTLYRKTTAMEVARSLAHRLFGYLLTSQNMTTEGIVSDMAGIEPKNLNDLTDEDKARWRQERNYAAQRGLVLDEASGLLAGAGRDYNAGLLEAFLQFYDNFEVYTRSTRGQGRVVIHNASLSILAASTPAAMAEHLMAERLWAMGWWPRFAILAPDDERPAWQEPIETEEPTELGLLLKHLHERLPTPSWPNVALAKRVTLGKGVLQAWQQYNRALSHELLREDLDCRLWGAYGRLPTHMLKVAMVLAAMDWREREAPLVELRHLARAMRVTETWRVGAHRALSLATRTDVDVMWQRITKQLGAAGPEGLTMRDLTRALRDVRPGALVQTVDEMVAAGTVEGYIIKPEGAGRPSKRFRLVTD